jgi:hypothetical protein
VHLLQQIQFAVNIRPFDMGQLGDNGGGVPRRRQQQRPQPDSSTDDGRDGSGVHVYQRNQRTAGGGGLRGVVEISTRISVVAASTRRRCVGPGEGGGVRV